MLPKNEETFNLQPRTLKSYSEFCGNSVIKSVLHFYCVAFQNETHRQHFDVLLGIIKYGHNKLTAKINVTQSQS